MTKETRHFVPPLAELIDRLTVDQIKEVRLQKSKTDVRQEMKRICADIDQIIDQKEMKLSSRLIRVIIALSQINLHIWNFKDVMDAEKDKDPAKYSDLLKLSHQLNGIRNQLKNALLAEVGEADGASVRSNFNTDGLSGWDIEI